MEIKDVLTNEINLRYDEEIQSLLLYRVVNGSQTEFPIELRLANLVEMGSSDASKWLGETIMLLIPEIRSKLFKIDE